MLGNDRGNATVTSAGIIAALVGVLFAVLTAFQTVLDDHQSRLAADLSAVAGAWAHAYGEDACHVARETARRNGGEATACHTEDTGDVTVTVTVGDRATTARAGPL
jgi:secretion/DNA translocation related TadE-like protein